LLALRFSVRYRAFRGIVGYDGWQLGELGWGVIMGFSPRGLSVALPLWLLGSIQCQSGFPHLSFENLFIVAEANSISPTIVDQDKHPGLRRARIAARVAAENRGRDIVLLDMRELTCMFDFFVLVSGTSRRQLHAISEEIDRVLQEELGDRRMGIEGYEESRWILLDYGDVVIHMFEPDTRAYYALEELWGQAKRLPLES
jgi:ribosome-associated protein